MYRCFALAALLWLSAVPAFAQTHADRPAPAVELTLGYAGFTDDSTISHSVFGAAARGHVSPRISLGPEVQYMRGPGDDRDLIVTGNVWLDFLPPSRRVTPFFVAGGGLFRHSDRFGSETFASTEGAFTSGVGVRGWLNERVYVAGDVRVGWELHLRAAGTIGVAFGR